jgi:hypothetical protein
MIIEEEQHGKERAEYGKALIRTLSERLIAEFGAGFGASNLAYFRQFYLSFPIFHAVRGKSEDTKTAEDQAAIRDAMRGELRWTHYRSLMRVEKPEAREWYMNEAAEQNWSTRALDRQINSLYYEREREMVVREMVVREQLERYGVEITMNTGKDQSLGFLQKT